MFCFERRGQRVAYLQQRAVISEADRKERLTHKQTWPSGVSHWSGETTDQKFMKFML